jgi:5-methyltetrahydrofolate--homocysteine methyltransferase
MQTVLSSEKKTVKMNTEGPVVIIGEKINPTGHKKMAAALTAKDYEYVRTLAIQQVAAGADVLDVNVGVPDLDDIAMLPEIVKLVSSCVDVPICLDSPNPVALAAGLKAVQGKPLVNSVSGEEARLKSVLPLVKERGAAVIGLIMDDNGIPATPEARLAVAEKILERAAQIGIPAEDIVIDPLVMAVGSDSQAGVVTLKTIQLIHEKLGVNINLGASNVSFGLPDRPTVNQAFMALAIQAGATCVITDPMKLTGTIRAADLVLGRDDYAARYLKYWRQFQALQAQQQAAQQPPK